MKPSDSTSSGLPVGREVPAQTDRGNLSAVDPGKGPQRLTVMNGLLRRLGVVRPKRHHAWLPAFAGACILLISLAPAACGSAGSAKSASPAYAGYVWQVVAISHDGLVTSIPARLQVALQFSWGGRFSADDSVNTYSGTYRATGGGFTSSALSATGVGYAGHDPAVLLAASAIRTFFDDGVHATVKLIADRLVVGVGSYTLTCQRRGFTPTPPSPVPLDSAPTTSVAAKALAWPAGGVACAAGAPWVEGWPGWL